MNDQLQVVALRDQAEAANERARNVYDIFIDGGCIRPGGGQISSGVLAMLANLGNDDRVEYCAHLGGGPPADQHTARPGIWLPAVPEYLRCLDCAQHSFPGPSSVDRYRCQGCGANSERVADVVGLLLAKVLDHPPRIVGPFIVAYTLCTDCQRVDAGGPDA